jgi:REP-associated tyrosine transposase
VTDRGTGRIPICRDDTDRWGFVWLLADAITRFGWTCHAYCLMTNHYHLVVGTGLEALSRGMARLNSIYARRFNDRHRRHGHLFAGRFVSFVVESDEHLAAACRYVVDNPVRAGLCEEACLWPWSGLGNPRPSRASATCDRGWSGR